jgi:hypothetical protein
MWYYVYSLIFFNNYAPSQQTKPILLYFLTRPLILTYVYNLHLFIIIIFI